MMPKTKLFTTGRHPEHAIANVNLAVRVIGRRHFIKTEPGEQPNGPGISAIGRCKERRNVVLVAQARHRGAARLERDAATPMIGRERKGEIGGERRINRCLNETRAPTAMQSHDPVEPLLFAVSGSPSRKLDISLR